MRRILFVIVISLIFGACGGSADGVGTVVINPPDAPSRSYMPSFNDECTNLNTVLGSASTSENSSQVTRFNNPNTNWDTLVTQGAVADVRGYLTSVEAFFETLFEAIQTDGNFVLSNEEYRFTLPGEALLGYTATWTVGIKTTDEGYVRVVGRVGDDMLMALWAEIYVDSNGAPLKGILSFINRGLVVDPTLNDNPRLYALAFDCQTENTDGDTKGVVHRFEGRLNNTDTYNTTYHLHIQCKGGNSDECTVEYIPIDSEPPDREFGDSSYRMAWDSSTISTAETSYTSDITTISNCESFNSSAIPPADADVTSGCSIETPEPMWGNSGYTTGCLLRRYDDPSDTAAQIAADDTLWPSNFPFSQVDSWLIGDFPRCDS